jgi:hypothetical protein
MPTRGIHLVSTTYGTWPPGDARGHWSPLLDFYGRLRERGHRLRLGDSETLHRATDIAHEPEKVLSSHEIQLVADTIGALVGVTHRPPLVAGRPNYQPPVIHAAAVERTHFHLLTGVMREDVGTFMGRIKGTTSSALRALPENTGRKHIWTAHYWEVFLFDEGGLDAVQTYIEAHNTRRGLPPNPFPWVHPRRLRK